MRPDTYTKDSDGHIFVGGVALSALAEQFGTPLYVMDYASIVRRMRAMREAVGPAGDAHYAAKAFCCQAVLELAAQEGLGVDVVSGGELQTARNAQVPMEQLVFHGNVKTRAEIEAGLQAGVGYFVVDSLDELNLLDVCADKMQRIAPVLLRLTPGIDAHTHAYVKTGHFDSKFGFATEGGAAAVAVEKALALPSIRLAGYHAHIGSQILDPEPLIENARALSRFSRTILEQWGFWPSVLDVGGGFGVSYDQEPGLAPMDALLPIRRVLEDLTPPGQPVPRLIIEPGRSIVAEAGFTLYRVAALKTTPGGRQYAAVDGGMGDNIRPALYQAAYQAELDGKPVQTPEHVVTLAGRYCESGDILIHNATLADPRVGDLVVVWATGAYNYSMASQYNRVPRPAVVAVHQGQYQTWVAGETWDDVLRKDQSLGGWVGDFN